MFYLDNFKTSLKCDRFILADILFANILVNFPKFTRTRYFFREDFWLLPSSKRKKTMRFCIFVYTVLDKKCNWSICRSKWEILDCGQYRF